MHLVALLVARAPGASVEVRIPPFAAVQCIAGAMTAGAAATGLRGWIVGYAGAWLTPRQ